MGVEGIDLIPTGVEGLDELFLGGLAPGVNIMVEGSPGTGKTSLAMQFILMGIERGEPGVYITLEESPAKLYRDALSHGWDFQALERENKLRVVATSPQALVEQVLKSGPLIDTIRELEARRAVIDPVTVLEMVSSDTKEFRMTLGSLLRGLEREGLMTLVTRDVDPASQSAAGFWSRYTVDALVSFTTEVLHSRLTRRILRVVKSRGQNHVTGLHTYAITHSGIKVFPRIPCDCPVDLPPLDDRVSSGVPMLDEMLRGGFIRGRTVLVSGPTGAGKTLLGLHFLADGAHRGEPVLLTTSEEIPQDTIAHGDAVGLGIGHLVDEGLFDVEYVFGTEMGPDEYLVRLKKRLGQKPYGRVLIDNVNWLETTSPDPRYTVDALTYLRNMLGGQKITALLIYNMPGLPQQTPVGRSEIEHLSNTVLLMQMIEVEGDIRKSISVLKHRGSAHDTDVREVAIDENGMRVLSTFEGVQGVITGVPVILEPGARSRAAAA